MLTRFADGHKLLMGYKKVSAVVFDKIRRCLHLNVIFTANVSYFEAYQLEEVCLGFLKREDITFVILVLLLVKTKQLAKDECELFKLPFEKPF